MKKIILSIKWLIIPIGLFSLTACESVSFGGSNSPSKNYSNSGPKNSTGLTQKEAREKSLALYPGMKREEVIALLGNPDETSAGTYGTKTSNPWQGVTFTYKWKRDHSEYSSTDRLQIIFFYTRETTGTLSYYVNSWDWYAF